MREFHEGFTSCSNDWDKRRNKLEKHSKSEECQCSPSSVKVHHLDCPLVKKRSCPLHRENLTAKSEAKAQMVMLIQSDRQNNLFYPLVPRKWCQSVTSKTKNCSFCHGHLSHGNRAGLKLGQVQTNADALKKSRNHLEGLCEINKVFVDEKLSKNKKLKKCFHSPCDSITHTSASEKGGNDHGLSKRTTTRNASVLVKTTSDESLDRIRKREKWPKTDNGTEMFRFDMKNLNEMGEKAGFHFSPYFLYPTMAATMAGEEKTGDTVRYKFRGEEFVSPGDKAPHGRDAPDAGDEDDNREDVTDATDSELLNSESSGSIFFTPLILIPNDHTKESREPFVNRESQTSDCHLRQDGTMCPVLCSPRPLLTWKENNSVDPTKIAPDVDNVQTKEAFTQMGDSMSSMSTSFDLSECEKTEEVGPGDEDLRVKAVEEEKTRRFTEFRLPQDLTPVLNETRTQKASVRKSVKSVKVQTVEDIAEDDSYQELPATNAVIERSWEKSEKISWSTKEIQLNTTELQNAPSTSYKMVEKTVSIRTEIPNSSECCCNEMISQGNAMNSPKESNDTYILKSFPSRESVANIEREINRWLNRSHSDSKLYKGPSSKFARKKNNDDSKRSSEESACCLYNDSAKPAVSGSGKKVTIGSVASKETKTSAVASSRERQALESQAEKTAVSDLSELIKMLDQRLDRITSEMKGLCDCDKQQVIKKEVVVRVEREVMTDAVEPYDVPHSPRGQTKEIHFAVSRVSLSESEKRPKGRSPSRIRQAVPLSETGSEVWICKICANMIKTFTADKGTNTDADKPKSPQVQNTYEYTKTTIKREATPLPASSTSKKPQTSGIPVPHKHQCVDTIVPVVANIKTNPPPKSPTHHQTNLPASSPRAKPDMKDSPSGTSRKRRRTFDKINMADFVLRSNVNLQERAKPSGGTNASSSSRSTSTNAKPASQVKPQAQVKVQRSTQPSARPPPTRKNPANFTFPVMVPALRLNEYIRIMRETALKHGRTKSSGDNSSTQQKSREDEESCCGENVAADATSPNVYAGSPENVFLRSTKSESYSCHYDHLASGHPLLRKSKDGFWFPPNVASSRENLGFPYEKAVKSEEMLKRGKRERKFSPFGDKELPTNTIGDNFRPLHSSNLHEFFQEKCKCFFCKCWTYFKGFENEQLFSNREPMFCPYSPSEYDISTPRDLSEDEQFSHNDDDDSVAEEGDRGT